MLEYDGFEGRLWVRIAKPATSSVHIPFVKGEDYEAINNGYFLQYGAHFRVGYPIRFPDPGRTHTSLAAERINLSNRHERQKRTVVFSIQIE